MILIKQIIAGGNVQLLLTPPNQFINIQCWDWAPCDTAAQRDYGKCHLYLLNLLGLVFFPHPSYLFSLYLFHFLLIVFITFLIGSQVTMLTMCYNRFWTYTYLLWYFGGWGWPKVISTAKKKWWTCYHYDLTFPVFSSDVHHNKYQRKVFWTGRASLVSSDYIAV